MRLLDVGCRPGTITLDLAAGRDATVLRPGGVLAVRDGDYGGFVWAPTAVSCGRRQTRCSIAGWSSTTTCAVTTEPTLTPDGACSAGRRERDAGDEPGDHRVHD